MPPLDREINAPFTSGSGAALPGKAPTWLSFDYQATHTFATIVPAGTINPSMVVFTMPPQVTYGLVERLAVMGSPYGQWAARVSWGVQLGKGSPQEYLAGSSISGAVPGQADSGSRWGNLGALDNPVPVAIKLSPTQSFGLEFRFADLNAGLFTVYVRAMGRIFR